MSANLHVTMYVTGEFSFLKRGVFNWNVENITMCNTPLPILKFPPPHCIHNKVISHMDKI